MRKRTLFASLLLIALFALSAVLIAQFIAEYRRSAEAAIRDQLLQLALSIEDAENNLNEIFQRELYIFYNLHPDLHALYPSPKSSLRKLLATLPEAVYSLDLVDPHGKGYRATRTASNEISVEPSSIPAQYLTENSFSLEGFLYITVAIPERERFFRAKINLVSFVRHIANRTQLPSEAALVLVTPDGFNEIVQGELPVGHIASIPAIAQARKETADGISGGTTVFLNAQKTQGQYTANWWPIHLTNQDYGIVHLTPKSKLVEPLFRMAALLGLVLAGLVLLCAFLLYRVVYGKAGKLRHKKHLLMLSTLTGASDDAMSLKTPEGLYYYVNPAFETMIGLPKEHFIGKKSIEHAENGHLARLLDSHLLESADKYNQVVPVDNNYYRIVQHSILDKEGTVLGRSCCIRDVSETIKQTQRMELQNLSLEYMVSLRTAEHEHTVTQLREAIDIAESKMREAQDAKDSLHERLREIETFHRLSVGREQRIVELKQDINSLSESMHLPPPYRPPCMGNSACPKPRRSRNPR